MKPVHTDSGGERQSPSPPAARACRPARTACAADCRASSSGRSPERRCASVAFADSPPSARAEHPRQQLPVAARPAVLAQRVDVVAGGKVFDDLDIGGQAGAREDPFEQIVAEQASSSGTRPASAASKASTS